MTFIKRLFFGALTVAFLAMLTSLAFIFHPMDLKTDSQEIAIPYGISLRNVAKKISDSGIAIYPWQFTLLATLTGHSKDIKSGNYHLDSGITPLGLLNKLTRNDITQGEVRLVEGKTFSQWRALLDAEPNLVHETSGLSDQDLLIKAGIIEAPAEGWFFPDAYLFSKGRTTDLEILRRAYTAMKNNINMVWAKKQEHPSPVSTPYEMLILASIIEKETGIAEDRRMVSAVFINRLNAKMPLQTDPTVIYGLGTEFQGRLLKADLQKDTAYNTYLRKGLPPTPISMPGLEALKAAVNPMETNVLYFVARGDGSSEFSKTLVEHNRAVVKYQLNKGQ